MSVIYERSFGDHLGLDGALEHFSDSLPIEWGIDLEEEVEHFSHIDDLFRGKWKLSNTNWFEVEIYFDENEKEWICKAYEIK